MPSHSSKNNLCKLLYIFLTNEISRSWNILNNSCHEASRQKSGDYHRAGSGLLYFSKRTLDPHPHQKHYCRTESRHLPPRCVASTLMDDNSILMLFCSYAALWKQNIHEYQAPPEYKNKIPPVDFLYFLWQLFFSPKRGLPRISQSPASAWSETLQWHYDKIRLTTPVFASESVSSTASIIPQSTFTYYHYYHNILSKPRILKRKELTADFCLFHTLYSTLNLHVLHSFSSASQPKW